VSSEAASALDISATSPAKLTVTALRKRTVKTVDSHTTELFSAETAQNVLAYKKSEKLKKPFIQIGIFNIEKNATNTEASMRRMGITPIIKEQKIKETQSWRVIVGPVRSLNERKTLLKMIISEGFKDAYAVTH
jgi:cell division septation protein DedD